MNAPTDQTHVESQSSGKSQSEGVNLSEQSQPYNWSVLGRVQNLARGGNTTLSQAQRMTRVQEGLRVKPTMAEMQKEQRQDRVNRRQGNAVLTERKESSQTHGSAYQCSA